MTVERPGEAGLRDVLFLSNGHGEDLIAGRILDELRALRPELTIDAWPMVGRGSAYLSRGIPTGGEPNLLPSEGFALASWKLLLRDLSEGWIGMYWRQFRHARRLRGRYRFMVAVGDIVPLLSGVLSKTPFVFVGCAKTAYYNWWYDYNPLERRLMRSARAVYPRDSYTARDLSGRGIEIHDFGNPMMDRLEPTGDRLGVEEDAAVIGMLAGTRSDAETNFLDLLQAAAAMTRMHRRPERLRIVFAARPEFDAQAMAARVSPDQWHDIAVRPKPVVMRLTARNGAQVLVAKDRFADVLQISDVVVGMAGTANEQAVGLGKPLVTAPSSGVQGPAFVRMKMQFFGESAVAVPRDPDAIARAALDILADPARAARMGAVGRERMGPPGASRAIAAEIAAMIAGEAA